MLDGILDFTLGQALLASLLLTHVTIASVTIYLHRHQAHRALDLHPLASHFFRFWLWLTTGMRTKDWVAVHRKHHAKVETPEDPHSPQVYGIRKVLLEGAELYRAEADNDETLAKYGRGTPDDWIERRVYTPYDRYGIVLLFLIDLALFGIAGIAVWGIQMLWIPFFAAGVINGVGHYWGYRNYEVSDASRNIVPWGILIGGEELHNNHHTFASSARLSSKWWEFDIGWLYIRLMQAVGLARVRKVAPRPVRDPLKSSVDMDTVVAIVSNRFQIMSHYGRDVLTRVYRDEMRQRADRPPRRARRLLLRNESLIDERDRMQIDSILSASPHLQTVYRFKLALQELWSRSTSSNEHLLQSLQDWCHQAEASGIKALQDFARTLRSYSMKPAVV
ncbi:MAG: transposase [Gammaproteobacteria bacterium]|jgi:stearoyl-CoA desaturase (delta-9 desaturase)|nr:transposase [Gammaproteobacteria bacterium]